MNVINSNSLRQVIEVSDKHGIYYYLMERSSGDIFGAWANRAYALSLLEDVAGVVFKEPDIEINLANGSRIPAHKNAAKRATMKAIARAFIYADHLESHSWYAYYPTADDSLDASGCIESRWFGTYNEAERYVIEAIGKAMDRPRMNGVGMDRMSVNV